MPAALPHHRTGRPSMRYIPTVIGTVHEGMDELGFDSQPGPPSLAGEPTPRKHRHVWVPIYNVDAATNGTEQWAVNCARCGIVRDETRSRRGRQSRNYGNRAELKASRLY